MTAHILIDADRGVFGAHLKRVREARKISQSRLAEHADFDHSYISRLESGARTPTREAVGAIAAALKLPPVEADRLLAAAGFLPRDTASLLETEPEVASLLTALHDEGLPLGLRELLRDQLAGLAAICAVDRGAR